MMVIIMNEKLFALDKPESKPETENALGQSIDPTAVDPTTCDVAEQTRLLMGATVLKVMLNQAGYGHGELPLPPAELS